MKIFWEPWSGTQRVNFALTCLIGMFTLVNAIATVVYVCTFKKSVTETSKQTDQLISAANIQADAAGRNADSAKESAQAASDFATQAKGINTQTKAAVSQFQRIAGDSEKAMAASAEIFRADQRPWVGLQVVQCDGCTIAEDGSLIIKDLVGVIANTGRTPALQMVVDNLVSVNVPKSDPIPDWASVEKRTKESEERAFKIPQNLPPEVAAEIAKSHERAKRDMASNKSVSVLPPNATRILHFATGFKIGRETFPRIDNRVVTYVFGKITYFDGRRDSQYTTTFCMVNEFGVDFRFCSTGNDMN